MLRSLFLILFSMVSIVGFCQIPAETQRALQAVSPDAIESTMNFLASDLLEGRQPGSKGFTTASQYVQTQFKTLGLQPGGEDNQYVQRVVLKKGVVDKNSSKFVLRNIDSEEWSYGNEFVFTPYMTREQSEVAAPLVFVGFGISAPELGYDDYNVQDGVKEKRHVNRQVGNNSSCNGRVRDKVVRTQQPGLFSRNNSNGD